jgi:putative phosphoribosyl transferase
MNDHLVVLDPALRVRGLQMPASARGLVLLVHVDSASQQRSGQRFIADVLRANGLATLAVTLHPAEEQRAGLPPPGQVLIKHRLRAVFDWLAIQASTRQCPVVLLGVDDAVRGCVAAAARFRPAALRSLILLDGRPYHVAKLLARLSQPTLMVVGACDTRSVNQHRAALRQMTAPSRLELLPMATQPTAASGAHQAFAHVVMRWLEGTLGGGTAAHVLEPAGARPTRAQAQGRDAAGAVR